MPLGFPECLEHPAPGRTERGKALREGRHVAGIGSEIRDSVLYGAELGERPEQRPGARLQAVQARGELRLLHAGADPYVRCDLGMDAFDICDVRGPFPRVRRAMEKQFSPVS